MFTVPFFYVASNRNKPELEKEYNLLKEKEVFLDFGLFQIFVFFGGIANVGFCRKGGCNVRIKPDQVCAPS